ncbi:MAG: V-type H+-transporting ATPase proteolipid subunit [Bacillariaceae sp.]|jgi:V-type H+-transporting ATPase proteolipid subunit
MSSLTCTSEYCNQGWSEVLTHMSPYGFANFGVALGLGLSIIGAAWGIWLTGSSRKLVILN